MPLTTRSNNDSTLVMKKVEAKITQGPIMRRAAFGDIGNRNGILNAKKITGKAVGKATSLSTINDKKAVAKVIGSRVQGKENSCVAKKPTKSLGDENQIDLDIKTLSKPEINEPAKEEPKLSTNEDKLIEAFSAQLLNVEDIDKDDNNNPQLVSDYVNDIYKYLRYLEDKDYVKEKYLENSTEVTPRMRTILIDWLVQVHNKFNLIQETLYLTIAILDRYLQVTPTLTKTTLQLVGVTAMFIASKYEEMYCPEVGDFAYITDKSFSKGQILSMEVKMLTALEYNVSFPLPLHFLRRNSKAGMVDAQQHTLAKYFMELCLPDYSMCHYKPSVIAAAALCLSINLLDEDPMWNDNLVYYSHYNEKEISPVISKIAAIVLKSSTAKQFAIRNKYKASKFMKVSQLPQLSSRRIKQIATASLY